VLTDRLFDLQGILSAPRFRSVLSHWIYHCELKGLYAKKSRLGIHFPFPADQEDSLPEQTAGLGCELVILIKGVIRSIIASQSSHHFIGVEEYG
jgi:hypothetical protein